MAYRWRSLKGLLRFRNVVKGHGPVLAAILLLTACNRTPSSTSSPTSTLPPPTAAVTVNTPGTPATAVVATSVVAAAETSAAPTVITATPAAMLATNGAGTIYSSPHYSYTVALPCCWMALPTPSAALDSALAQLEKVKEVPGWSDLIEEVQKQKASGMLELIALLPDKENVAMPVAQMTVSVLPTHGLTLDDYLAATSQELNGIANTVVLSATIAPNLGLGAMPASVIAYSSKPVIVAETTPGSSAANTEHDTSIEGLQIAFFGQDPTTLIVMTFTTTSGQYLALESEFFEIVRSVTWLETDS